MRARDIFFSLTLVTSVFGCSSSGGTSTGGPTPVADGPVADDAHHPVHAVAPASRTAAYAVAIDGDQVYFTTDTAVMSAPLAGGEAKQLAAASPIAAAAIAVDSSSIFWADRGQGSDSSAVRLAGKSGGAPLLVGTARAPAQGPIAIAVNDKNVYYASADGTIRSVPKGGGDEVVIASGQQLPTSIAVDVEAVYWATTDGAVRKVYLGDAIINNIVPAIGTPIAGITVDDTCIYFSDVKAGAIKMTWKDGSHPQAVAENLVSPSAIVEDEAGKTVYFLVDGALMKVSEDGGPAERVAHGINGGTGLAVVQGKGTVVWGSKIGVYATTSL